MLIVTGTHKKVKIDRFIGNTICPNCNHRIEETLAHEACYQHIFYIPFFFYTATRMKLCPNCGIIEKVTKKEFKDLKKQFPKEKRNEE